MSHLILFRVNCCWGVAMVVWQLDLKLPVQSVPITTIIESSNPVYADVYLIQQYVIKFVTGVWFSPGALVSSTNKTDHHDKKNQYTRFVSV